MYTYACHNTYLVKSMVKSLPAVWETWVWSHGKGNDNLLQYSCLENSMDRWAWWATVYGLQRVIHVITHTFVKLKMKAVTFYTCLDTYHFVTVSSFLIQVSLWCHLPSTCIISHPPIAGLLAKFTHSFQSYENVFYPQSLKIT